MNGAKRTLQTKETSVRSEGWVALSDLGLLQESPKYALLERGLFVMELALPLQNAEVLLDHKSNIGWPRTFAIFHEADTGIVVLHRQGSMVARHCLPGPLPQGLGTARLSFCFDAPARVWELSFEILSTEVPTRVVARGRNPLPLPFDDLAQMCDLIRPNGPVLWFGLTQGVAPPRAASWVGQRTPIETSRGTVMAGNLKPGDMIFTADHGALPLLDSQSLALPARGSFAPVRLRSPFFGQNQDLLVSADQMLAVSGLEVEYLFGAESVLMPARTLVDGRTALLDQRRAVTRSVALDLGRPALIEANGCLLAIGHDAETEMPLRSLQGYEVLTLMTLMGRTPRLAA